MVSRNLLAYLAIVFGIIFIAFSVAAGREQVTGAEVGKEVSDAAEKTKAFASQQVETYTKEMQAKLDTLSKRIKELKEKAKTATGDAQAKSQQVIADLQSKMDVARQELKDVGTAGADTWKDVKTRFDKLMENLNKAFDEAFGKSK
ncbi:MAG: hypothetical protein LDL33_05880 [Desulfomonile sp.]|nr:hypothetical protein [Desulfomonile sp.]